MRRFSGWIALAAVALIGAGFAIGNAGRVVSINLGLFSLDSAPVTFVAFGGMVVGMAVVLAAGINSDLKVRRLLRERRAESAPPKPADGGAGAAPDSGGADGSSHEQGDMQLE